MSAAAIAFQGAPGAYSDLAARTMLPGRPTLPLQDFADVFEAVREGQADLGLIPVENSIAGRVADIHHLLPGGGLHIIGETFQPIHHHLMSLPGTRLEDLEVVHSHVHALGQCRNFLRRHGLRPVVLSDTAGAARDLAEQRQPRTGVIASRLAAELYGLQILDSQVADAENNVTRFLLLSREAIRPHPPVGQGLMVTSLTFDVRNLPAALYKVLGGFATNGLNLTRLESYMVGGAFTATRFLLDVEGHPEDPPLARALEELAFFSTRTSILGVYPGHPYRLQSAQQVLMAEVLSRA